MSCLKDRELSSAERKLHLFAFVSRFTGSDAAATPSLTYDLHTWWAELSLSLSLAKNPWKKRFRSPQKGCCGTVRTSGTFPSPTERERERACRSGLSAPRTCVRNPCLGWVGMLQKQLDRHCTALNLGVVCCASRPREEPGHQPAGRSQLLRVVTELGSPVLFSRSADVRREDNIRRIPRGSSVRGTSSFRV